MPTLSHTKVTFSNLTNFQKNMLADMAAGYSIKEISTRRNVKFTTVESYRTRMLKHLGARNGTHLVALAFQHKILHLDIPAPRAGSQN